MDKLISTHFRRLPHTDVIVVMNIFSGEGYLHFFLIDQVTNGSIAIINHVNNILTVLDKSCLSCIYDIRDTFSSFFV